MANNQEGPFSEYLTQPYQPQTPQATGWEGTGANVAFIASKFLDGIRSHRAQQFAQQQADEEKKLKAFNMALQAIQSNQNLTPLKKQELSMPLIQGIVAQAGGIKEGSKHTGNGLTDAFKNMFMNITGGPGPTKTKPLDMATVGDIFTQMEDKENHISTHTSRAEQEISQYIQSRQAQGLPVSKQGLMMDPTFRAIIQRTHQATGDTSWMPNVDNLPDSDTSALAGEYNQSRLLNRLGKTSAPPPGQNKGQQPPLLTGPASRESAPGMPTIAPVSSQQASSIQQAPPAVTTQAPATSTPPGQRLYKTADEARREIARLTADRDFDKSMGLVPPEEGYYIPTEEKTDAKFIDPSAPQGKRIFQGVRIGDQIFRVGGNREYVPDSREALASDIAADIPPEKIEAAKTALGGYKADVKALFKDNPELVKSYETRLDSAMTDNNPEDKMSVILGQAQQQARILHEEKSARENQILARNIAAGARSDSNLQHVIDKYIASDPVKDDRVASNYQDQVARSMQNAARSGNYGNADLLLIRAIAKLTDITTGIRDREYDTFAEAAGKLQTKYTQLKAILDNNGNKLDPETRALMMQDLASIKGVVSSRMDDFRKQILSEAKELGVGDRVARIIGTPQTSAPPPAAQSTTPQSQGAAAGLGRFPGRQTRTPGVTSGKAPNGRAMPPSGIEVTTP